MIFYLPLESEPMRYTEDLDRHIVRHLTNTNEKFVRIDPELPSVFERSLPTGLFLDAPRTIAYKARQLQVLAAHYASDTISDGDIVFLSDLWCPGIESVRYLDFFCKKKVSLRGILHAGSFTDTDFVRQLERWASQFENTLFDIFDRVYVASEFIKRDVCAKRLLDPSKVFVTPFPLDARAIVQDTPRQNIVVFNGRLCDEKQPWLFEELKKRARVPADTKWVNTQEARLSKDDYYRLLRSAKCVVSFALQENFGFGIAEATMAGCLPVVPDRLVYPELYPHTRLYKTFEECVRDVEDAINAYDVPYQASVKRYLADRIRPNIGAWFSQ